MDPRTFAPTEGSGALALQPQEWRLEDYAVEEQAHPLAEELYVSGMITAEGFYVLARCRKAAEHLMHRRAR